MSKSSQRIGITHMTGILAEYLSMLHQTPDQVKAESDMYRPVRGNAPDRSGAGLLSTSRPNSTGDLQIVWLQLTLLRF